MTDIKPNEEVKEESQEEVKDTLNLEEVHAKAVYEIENDNQEEQDENENEADEDEDEQAEEDSQEDSGDSKEEDSGKTPVPIVPAEEAEEEADPVQADEKEIPKVKIRDADGKEHEFESALDIPDDFEPFSYKELAVGATQLSERQAEVRRQRERQEEADTNKKRTDAIAKTRAKWESELNKLVDTGKLDKDKDKRQADVDAIYTVMQESINDGNTITSFQQAYEIYQYRKSLTKEDKTAVNAEKKKAGSRIMPGGGSKPPGSKPSSKVFQAPPSGVSLDAIHESILSSL